MHYSVVKTTTDKLEQALEPDDDGWELYQATHVGGRDWVLIFQEDYEFSDEDEPFGVVAAQIKQAARDAAHLYGGPR